MSMPSVARQARPEITLAVCRGACRLMRQAGHSVLLEVPLPDGRRADIFAVGRGGEITIVEVKSSIEDWRVDEQMARLSRLVRPALRRRARRFPAGADSRRRSA